MSLRAAINAMCKHCIYDESPGNGNWRQQVGACTATNCPLYNVRPVSQPKKAKRNVVDYIGQNGAPNDNGGSAA